MWKYLIVMALAAAGVWAGYTYYQKNAYMGALIGAAGGALVGELLTHHAL